MRKLFSSFHVTFLFKLIPEIEAQIRQTNDSGVIQYLMCLRVFRIKNMQLTTMFQHTNSIPFIFCGLKGISNPVYYPRFQPGVIRRKQTLGL
jgi:hypothetical protein